MNSIHGWNNQGITVTRLLLSATHRQLFRSSIAKVSDWALEEEECMGVWG